jgi:hypothetical protein
MTHLFKLFICDESPTVNRSFSSFIIDDHLWWMDSAIHPKWSFKAININPPLAATSSCQQGVFRQMLTSDTAVHSCTLYISVPMYWDNLLPEVISKSDDTTLRQQENTSSNVTSLFYVSGSGYEQVTRPLFLESAKRNAIVMQCKNTLDISLWLEQF